MIDESGRRFPCPACGYLSFEEPPGSDQICPICFWEDDIVALVFATTFATTYVGLGNKVSLLEAQENFARIGAVEERVVKYTRKPRPGEPRDPTWRPIDLTKDEFESRESPLPTAAEDKSAYYYWSDTPWRGRYLEQLRARKKTT